MATTQNNARQIAVYQTNKYLLEANDHLRVVEEGSKASNLHHPYSKIQLVALDYSDKAKKIHAQVNLDPDKFLLLANDVLSGQFNGFSETKLLGHQKRDDGKVRTTVIRVQYRAQDNKGNAVKMPWTVIVDNGWSTPQRTETGGTYAVKGSYEADTTEQGVAKSVKVFFSYDDFRRFVLSVANYIRTFEQAVFPHCIKLRKQYEDQLKAEQQQTAAQ